MENFRLFDLLYALGKSPHKEDALATKENGVWKKYSTREYTDLVNYLSYAFIHIGIQPGDKVGLISNNRPEWNFTDYACLQTGAISVPLYPTISDNDLTYIIKDAEIKYFFVANDALLKKVKNCSVSSAVKEIYSFDKKALKCLQQLLDLGKAEPKEKELEHRKSSIKNTDLATLIYTSGTTGNPKGVMLSHKNFISNVIATQNLAPFKDDWRALSFLPLNHVYERMLSYLYVSKGVSVYYAESLETIGENLKEVKPHIFVTVPRLLEKVYEKIVAKGNELTGIKKALFFWALRLGLKYEPGANGWWYKFQLKIANKLIFSKWREALGGNVVSIVSGGAALQPRLARIFMSARITIQEGYGLTETSPVIAVNGYGRIKIGTVGEVINNVEVKIAEDGEIYARGNSIMMGYYKQPELTKEVIDNEGWFHTGDIGTFEDERFLKIIDRKKEIFKTSGGKYITPQLIENKLKESRFIEQAMVIGENEKFPAAFIVPAFTALKDWCAKEKISYHTDEEMLKKAEVIALINAEVEKANGVLAQYEKIKKFELLSREWSIDKGELTPKLSLKRKVILAANKAVYEKIYPETMG